MTPWYYFRTVVGYEKSQTHSIAEALEILNRRDVWGLQSHTLLKEMGLVIIFKGRKVITLSYVFVSGYVCVAARYMLR